MNIVGSIIYVLIGFALYSVFNDLAFEPDLITHVWGWIWAFFWPFIMLFKFFLYLVIPILAIVFVIGYIRCLKK